MLLDGVVTVVDAKRILEHLGQDGHADEQVAYADLLVINKVDLVSELGHRHVVDAIAGINAGCEHIAIRDVPERMVFQGVHGIFRLTLGQPWAGEPLLTQAVFIGRNLRREEIVSGVESCRAG